MTDSVAISDFLPHAAPMALLDELIQCSDDSISCRLQVRGDGLFNRGAVVPAWLGIEYMAQCVAAYSGYWRVQDQLPARVGFLLGTRRFNTNVAEFQVGQILLVSATKVIQSSNGMASFNCVVEGEGVEQSAALSVFEPDEKIVTEMLKDGP